MKKDDFDWVLAGLSPYQIPRTMPKAGDMHSMVTNVASLAAAFDDPATHPHSGGVIGQQAIADRIGLSDRQARRTVLKQPFVRYHGRVAASNVASLDAWAETHRAEARAAHMKALGLVDPSSGTNLATQLPNKIG